LTGSIPEVDGGGGGLPFNEVDPSFDPYGGDSSSNDLIVSDVSQYSFPGFDF